MSHRKVIFQICITVIVLLFGLQQLSYGKSFVKELPPTQTSNAVESGLSFGLKTGFTVSNFSQNYQREKTSFAIGVFTKIQAIKFLGIEIDVLFAQEGANQVSPGFIYDASVISVANISKVNSNVTINSLQVPVLFLINPPDLGYVSPHLILGGSFDYYLNVITYDLYADLANALVLADRQKENVSSAFAKYNYAAVMGFGIDFFGSKRNYTLELRYKLGLQTINNLATYNVGNFTNEDFSSNSFQILFSVSF